MWLMSAICRSFREPPAHSLDLPDHPHLGRYPLSEVRLVVLVTQCFRAETARQLVDVDPQIDSDFDLALSSPVVERQHTVLRQFSHGPSISLMSAACLVIA